MIVGVAGLGLIGGSFVKGYHSQGHTVYAYNRSRKTLDYALLSRSEEHTSELQSRE